MKLIKTVENGSGYVVVKVKGIGLYLKEYNIELANKKIDQIWQQDKIEYLEQCLKYIDDGIISSQKTKQKLVLKIGKLRNE